eukprot:GHVS01097377.1.p1 GENE.GHVS01097377.1~~GHVS01097377.1.p1  ORF type:complete len:285 (-),score=19.71 GHVS01097377.1:108-962(-)
MANRSSSALFVLIVVAALLVLFALNGVESVETMAWRAEVTERLGIKESDHVYQTFRWTRDFKQLAFYTADDGDGIGVTVREVEHSGELGPVLPVIAQAIKLNGGRSGRQDLLIVTATHYFEMRFENCAKPHFGGPDLYVESLTKLELIPNNEEITDFVRFPAESDSVKLDFQALLLRSKGKLEYKGTGGDVQSGFVQLLVRANNYLLCYFSEAKEWAHVSVDRVVPSDGQHTVRLSGRSIYKGAVSYRWLECDISLKTKVATDTEGIGGLEFSDIGVRVGIVLP